LVTVFDELKDIIKLSQGVSKSIAGVQGNVEVIPEYQLEEICEPCY
jgi:hypothetical protein